LKAITKWRVLDFGPSNQKHWPRQLLKPFTFLGLIYKAKLKKAQQKNELETCEKI